MNSGCDLLTSTTQRWLRDSVRVYAGQEARDSVGGTLIGCLRWGYVASSAESHYCLRGYCRANLQIVRKHRGKVTVLEHLGPAHNEAELTALLTVVRKRYSVAPVERSGV